MSNELWNDGDVQFQLMYSIKPIPQKTEEKKTDTKSNLEIGEGRRDGVESSELEVLPIVKVSSTPDQANPPEIDGEVQDDDGFESSEHEMQPKEKDSSTPDQTVPPEHGGKIVNGN